MDGNDGGNRRVRRPTPKVWRPRILVLDDAPEAISHLDQSLAKLGCEVVMKENVRDANEHLASHVVDLTLLDVNLSDKQGDHQGVDFAQAQIKEAPEAAVVFISRPSVMQGQSELVLQMFNRRFDLGLGRRRLAEGYADKENPERVIELVEDVLKERGWFFGKAAPDLQVSDTQRENLENHVRKKWPESFREPLEQLFRIVRALCVSTLGTTAAIRISGVSRGRSRSVVLSVECLYRNNLSEQRILKIGSRQSIEMEVTNYGQHVPSLLAGGSYPGMHGHAASRELAGICYSEVSSGGGLPDSFADKFWQMDSEAIEHTLDEIYHQTIVDTSGVQKTLVKSFNGIYAKRWQNLQSPALHEMARNSVNKCHHFKARDSEAKDYKNLQILDQGLRGAGDLIHPCYGIARLESFKSAGFYEAVVHGDLHPDNILMPSGTQTFLIDFTHTAVHHASIDHLVMEAMMRSQLLRQLFARLSRGGADKKGVKAVLAVWLRIETAISQGDWSESEALCEQVEVADEFRKLAGTIKWLRQSAARRSFLEPREFYHAGLGAICYSFLALPDDSAGKEWAREVLLYVSSLAFTKAFGKTSLPPLVRSDLARPELDRALADATSAWKGWMMRIGRRTLTGLTESKLQEPSTREEVDRRVAEVLAALRKELPQLCANIAPVAGALKIGDRPVAEAGFQPIAELVVIGEFLGYAHEAGLGSRIISDLRKKAWSPFTGMRSATAAAQPRE